jgi:hypothetical protein
MRRSEPVTGGCFCGVVRYEARVYLNEAYYCHCRICQKSSGTPAEVAVFVEPGSLRFTSGSPKFFQTSPFGERGFCAACGSRLMWKHVGESRPEYTSVSVGSLDAPENVIPAMHQCVESRLPWYQPNADLPALRKDEIPELLALWEGAEKSGGPG